jgi:NADPH:quinone reductase-like Zn-dependent oxidoreductase
VIDEIDASRFRVPISRVFALDDIAAAHRLMEDNTAGGKIVVVS